MASVAKRTWAYKGAEKTAWVVRYVDQLGVHRQRTFEKKKDADLYRSKVEIDLNKNLHLAAAERMSFRSAAMAFSRTLDERVRDGRIGRGHERRLDIMLRIHVLPYLGDQKLDRISLASLEAWHREMKAARNLSPRTAKTAVHVVKMVFDHAIKRDWTFRNPANLLLSELRGQAISEVRTFTIEEVRSLLTAVDAKMYRGRTPDAALRLQCAVHLATFCGLRLGEILGLRRANIDFVNGLILVRNSLSRYDGLKAPKSLAGSRDVAMPAHVEHLLRRWIDAHYVPVQRGNHHGLMFCYRDGRPMDSDGFRHGSWGPLLVRAGLSTDPKRPPFHFHALRHFAASWMIESGWNLTEVASALGHAKVDMTMKVYAHALRSRAKDPNEMQALTDRLRLPPPVVNDAQIAHGGSIAL